MHALTHKFTLALQDLLATRAEQYILERVIILSLASAVRVMDN